VKTRESSHINKHIVNKRRLLPCAAMGKRSCCQLQL